MIRIPLTFHEPATAAICKQSFRQIFSRAVKNDGEVRVIAHPQCGERTRAFLGQVSKLPSWAVSYDRGVDGDDVVVFIDDRVAIARVKE